MSREAFMVIDAAGQPGRRLNPGLAPIYWNPAAGRAAVAEMDRLARAGVPGAPHRVVPVRIEEIET